MILFTNYMYMCLYKYLERSILLFACFTRIRYITQRCSAIRLLFLYAVETLNILCRRDSYRTNIMFSRCKSTLKNPFAREFWFICSVVATFMLSVHRPLHPSTLQLAVFYPTEWGRDRDRSKERAREWKRERESGREGCFFTEHSNSTSRHPHQFVGRMAIHASHPLSW